MIQTRSISAGVVLSLALATELTLGLGLGNTARAQFNPPDLGAPRTTAGGATRSGSCTTEKTLLTALVPTKTQTGLTTQERPSFFVYLPKTTAQSAEFILIDDTNSADVYSTMIPLSGQSGIVRLQLSADAPALEVGKNYQWYFSIVCDPRNRLRDDFVTAWIQRVKPSATLTRTLGSTSPRKRPNLYAQAGIWQDTLAELSELQRTQGKDKTLNEEWKNLLKSVGLGQISGGPPVTKLSFTMYKQP